MNAKKELVEARKLKGFRDYLPNAAAIRHTIIEKVRTVAELSGFRPIDTPALEYADVLLGSGGGDTDKEVYRFTDHGDRAVALRFDLTVPFARYVTENFNELVFPFKKLQIGDVWRGEKPQKGRYRQFCQADLDIIGADSLQADVEVLGCLYRIVDAVLPANVGFTMSLNSRAVLSGMIQRFYPGMDTAAETKILVALDKLQKIGRDAVADLMSQIHGDKQAALALLSALDAATNKPDWSKLASELSGIGTAADEVRRFQETINILNQICTSPRGKIKPMLNVARGLGYYTGIVYETTVDDLASFGSISSGGRYNNLVARFGKHDLPGVGGSIGVDRLLAALEELGALVKADKLKCYLAIATEDATGLAFKILSQLRNAGIASDIASKAAKLGNQFKYADKLGIPYVITVGSDEVKSQTCSIKHMKDGSEEKGVALGDVVKRIIGLP